MQRCSPRRFVHAGLCRRQPKTTPNNLRSERLKRFVAQLKLVKARPTLLISRRSELIYTLKTRYDPPRTYY